MLRQRADRLDSLFISLRLLTGIAAAVLAYLVYRDASIWQWVLLTFCAIVFSIVVFYHARAKNRLADLDRLIEYTEQDDARIALDWSRIPDDKTGYGSTDNQKGIDLNIVGARSLSHLIDTSSSVEARNRLLSLLLDDDVDIEAVRSRQALVQSLIPKYLLLAKLRLATGNLEKKVLSGRVALAQLKNHQYPIWGKPLLIFCALLALANIVLLGLSSKWVVVTFTVYVVLLFLFAQHSSREYSGILDVKYNIDRLSGMLAVLENRYDTDAPELMALLAPLHNSASKPSILIRRVGGAIDALSVRAFPLVHILLNAVVPWDQFFVYRLQSIKHELQDVFPVWLQVTAEVEANCALAHFGRLNPDYCVPELVSCAPQQITAYQSLSLGHPLIDRAVRVSNDFSIRDNCTIGIVTGSNMAGKTAFLRTVGINICLAQAGARVCATSYKSILYSLSTCINVADDLENGKSLFYCEIEKLKIIIDKAEQSSGLSVMFLIDELLKGTNSRERILGGKRYIERISESDSFGLISTHDLEFAELANTSSKLFNVHFRDTVIDDKMTFDHKLYEGPSKGTNALRIMEVENII